MRLAQLSAIAALTLSLAAGTALAASTSNDDSQGTTNTADGENPDAGREQPDKQ